MVFEDRQDKDLAFMLKFENVAWYEDGKVSILDRRIYPIEVKKVICTRHEEVADAIKDMVTQSEGPYIAACHGMVLAAYEATVNKVENVLKYMEKAAYTLTHARPTTTSQMTRVISGCVKAVEHCVANNIVGQEFIDAVNRAAYDFENNNYRRYTKIGENMAKLIPDNGTILTQCFGGTVIGTMLRACREMGKEIKVICAETRPYYQGARLTASVACDMGFDVTVISDNMPAYTMKTKGIDLFTSASDVITLDGHVVNKVGTFQIALACKYFGIPYYCTGTPDPAHEDMDSVVIEERDPMLVMKSLDTKITMDGVKGYYPAFDDTPPELVTGIVTELGVYKATELAKYFEDGGK